MIKILRLILFPITIVYALVVYIRNFLFNSHIFHSTVFSIPIISVGNLAVGGSGKTPVTEYLVKLLSDKKIAILSRGYGRKTTGFIVGGINDSAETIGDEPMQYMQKFPDITVAVCEDRVAGIQQLMDEHDLILLDDAYQHRWVLPGLSLLLFDYNKMADRLLLPTGNLREPFINHKRADIILITKVPVGTQESKLTEAGANFSSDKSLYFSGIKYGNLKKAIGLPGEELFFKSNMKVILVTGIASPIPLVEHVKSQAILDKHFNYPDHYQFKQSDIESIVTEFVRVSNENTIILTTEKDAQRLFNGRFDKLLVNLPVYTIPIQIEILHEGKIAFDKKIKDYVASATRNN